MQVLREHAEVMLAEAAAVCDGPVQHRLGARHGARKAEQERQSDRLSEEPELRPARGKAMLAAHRPSGLQRPRDIENEALPGACALGLIFGRKG